MTLAEQAERFIEAVRETVRAQEGTYAFSGDTARCLWMLAKIPGASLELWKKVCHPWPGQITAVGDVNGTAVTDRSVIALECGAAMLNSRVQAILPGFGETIPLVQPTFVLAQIMTEADPLKVTRVADMLRCVRPDVDVDLEEVRSLLKAVRSGELYETLLQVAHVV